jgi:hypothetical protein
MDGLLILQNNLRELANSIHPRHSLDTHYCLMRNKKRHLVMRLAREGSNDDASNRRYKTKSGEEGEE